MIECDTVENSSGYSWAFVGLLRAGRQQSAAFCRRVGASGERTTRPSAWSDLSASYLACLMQSEIKCLKAGFLLA